jgi:demethylmenaquinone methyltransferase / 2-methoxy-6-polyprenyl-1,4-benzoquinol methylase
MNLDKSSDRVRRMFGEIAGRYDLLNHLLSLGIDRRWRRRTVTLVRPENEEPILDVCTGTADLALAYSRAAGGKAAVVATDFCRPMLAIGLRKCQKTVGQVGNLPGMTATARCLPVPQPGAGITLLEADTLHLPFPDNTFQIVSVAFGLRNLADPDAGLQEMARVCRPGGRVAVLEFSTPTLWPLGTLYRWYFHHLLPRIGQALARNTQAAYNYLPTSVGRFPQTEALVERLRAAGLADATYHQFTCGVATLYIGRK